MNSDSHFRRLFLENRTEKYSPASETSYEAEAAVQMDADKNLNYEKQ